MRNGDDGRGGEQPDDDKWSVVLTNRTSDKWDRGLRAKVGMSR
jgi:hypothetical protein